VPIGVKNLPIVPVRDGSPDCATMISPDFKPLARPVLFDGYYGKEAGHPYSFRLRPRGTTKFWPHADWIIANKHLEIPFVLAPGQPYDVAPRDLTVALAEIVKLHGAKFDGSFIINEFGGVLVPSRDGSQVFHVGDWKGTIWMEDAYHPDGDPIELYGVEGLRIGDTWKHPYVGMSYTTAVFGDKVLLTTRSGQGAMGPRGYFDAEVLPLLRRVHWDSKMQFLVTYGGLMLTRVSLAAKGDPEPPVFCGTLDLDKWKSVVATL
jgi:hypothetical protein